jgi:hypothetical protein
MVIRGGRCAENAETLAAGYPGYTQPFGEPSNKVLVVAKEEFLSRGICCVARLALPQFHGDRFGRSLVTKTAKRGR